MLMKLLKRIKPVRDYLASKEKMLDIKTLEHSNANAKECYMAKNKAKKHESFFVQKILFLDIYNRMNLFEYYCSGKKVLHIGCTDYPILNPKKNLHIYLSKLTSEIHGLDLDIEGLKVLKQYVDQPYFSSLADVKDSYDICLIPEVIEHVDNISLFLKDIEKIDAKLFIIAAPNAFGNFYRNLNYFKTGELSVEIEHPDHNCYFSPYTLKNAIQKYSCLKVQNIFLTDKQKSVACICKR
jgi:hypothetical protein